MILLAFFEVGYVDNYVDNLWIMWITNVDNFFDLVEKGDFFPGYPQPMWITILITKQFLTDFQEKSQKFCLLEWNLHSTAHSIFLNNYKNTNEKSALSNRADFLFQNINRVSE